MKGDTRHREGLDSGFRGQLDRMLRDHATGSLAGRVLAVRGGAIRGTLDAYRVGEAYRVARGGGSETLAQVVGFDDDGAVLLPFESTDGIAPGAVLRKTSIGTRAPSAESVLGDVIDAIGTSLVSGRQHECVGLPLSAAPPSPLTRRAVDTQCPTSLRAIDAFMPFGIGQRVGLFAGSGVGKSTLLAQLTRGFDADVVIVALVGERGREVGEFLNDVLDSESRRRATIVVATSDAPPMLRLRAAEMATALAEDWRARGKHVLLLVDSLTRYARALREAALLSGEPPARRGYPASVFARLPMLLERAGQSSVGAISAVYSVLVAGGDMEEPVADEVRGIVDGHWVLRRELAERGHFPAIDVLSSVSRVSGAVSSASSLQHATAVRRSMAILAAQRDAVDLGIYRKGTNAELDRSIAAEQRVDAFLKQNPDEFSSLSETQAALGSLATLVGGL